MFTRLSHTYKALLLGLVAYIAFSVSDAAVKVITPYYSVYQIVWGDLGIASVIFLLLAPKLGGIKQLKDPLNTKAHLIRGAMNFLGSMLIVYFFSIMPLTSVYTVIFLSPFMMTLIAIPMFKEHVSWNRWIAMAAGFTGVLIAFRPWESDISILTFLMLLGAPLCFSVMHSMMRTMKNPSDIATGFYPLAIAVLPMTVLTFTIGDYVPFAPAHIIPLVISAVAIVIGFITVSRAYHMADASLVAPVQYTQMIWGVILGALLFDDLPDLWMLTGAAIIIASGIYLIRSEHATPSDASPNTPTSS